METIRAYKFRIYPDYKRQQAIDNSILLANFLYNKLLEKTIGMHKKNANFKISQKTINGYLNEILAENKEYYALYSHVRVDIRNRLLRNYQNFFRRCREKKSGKRIKVGFPRFKSRDKYNSIMHIENNGSFSIEKGRLRISKIGTMRIEQHRRIEGAIKTMTIKREGKEYYAIFTAIKQRSILQIKDDNPIGIDLGLNSFIALSDGKKIEKPKFFKRKEKRVSHWQRVIARRRKGSRKRQKAKERLQSEWKSITNQSNDFMHKLSDNLVKAGYTSFAVEKLDIPNMAKNHKLASSIQNASWNRFINFLSYKAGSAGMKVMEVDARNTSKICSNCGNIMDMPLSERIYNCKMCNMHMDRDVNAAINILNRATLGQRGSHAQGEIVRPQQEAVLKELGTNPAYAGEANDL